MVNPTRVQHSAGWRVLTALMFLAATLPLGAAPRAELLSSVATVRPGDSFQVGVHLVLEDGWHTYWRNPGDSGAAPRLRWHLPEGCSAGPIEWPAPQRFTEGGLVSFGYEKDVTFLVTLQTTTNLAPASVMLIRADLSVLVCKDACVPHEFSLRAGMRLADETTPADSDRLARLADANARLPVADPDWRFASLREEENLLLFVDLPTTVDVATLQDSLFFPSTPGQLELSVASRWTMRDGMHALQLRPTAAVEPRAPLDGVLVWPESSAAAHRAVHVHAPPP